MTDFNKPITTRCGYPVEIWTTEANIKGYPIHGEYFNDKWYAMAWSIEGWVLRYDTASDLDLINPPEEIELWVNIYDVSHGICSEAQVWDTKELADEKANGGRIACIKIEFKEGDGLC